VNPPPKMDVNRLLRADSIGRSRDNSMVPFLNAIFERTLELTSHVKDKFLFYTREIKRGVNPEILNPPVTFAPTDETYRMLELVYGLTRDDERKFRLMLSKVPSLPYVVDFAPLHHAMCVDGVSSSPDFVDPHTPMSRVCISCKCDNYHSPDCNQVSQRLPAPVKSFGGGRPGLDLFTT